MPDIEKVFDAIRNCITEPKCKDCPWEECEKVGCKRVTVPVTLMFDVLNVLKEQEWNLLTEDDEGIIHGLPGDDGQYLMSNGKDIWIDWYVDGVVDGIMLDSGRDIREITAWMNMPELPKKVRR